MMMLRMTMVAALALLAPRAGADELKPGAPEPAAPAGETVPAQAVGGDKPIPAAPPPVTEAPSRISEIAASVPDSQKPARSREFLERMRDILSKVLRLEEGAREEKDLVKLNCINEKLTSVKGLLKISEQADVTMQEALSRRNTAVVQHEFEKISIAASKSEQLFAESEACVGEMSVYAGDTTVEVVIEGGQPNPYQDLPRFDVIERPPAASPFQ